MIFKYKYDLNNRNLLVDYDYGTETISYIYLCQNKVLINKFVVGVK